MQLNKIKLGVKYISLAFLIGCKAPSKDITESKNILRWCFFNDIVSLDPSRCADIMSWGLLKQIFEPLCSVDEKGNIIPCLAEKWFVSSDNKIYTFHLKKDVKFHDGTVMNAKDVQASLERTCSPSVNSPVALQYLGDIEGAEEFNSGKAAHIKGIKLLSEDKIQINLKKPTSYFLSKLTNCVTGVMGAATRHKKDFLKCEDLIGTGPFKLKNHAPKQELDLVAHLGYHDGKVKIDGINIKVMGDLEQAMNQFKLGNIDLCDVSFKQVEAIKKDSTLKDMYKQIDSPAIAFVTFNIDKPIFSNKFFRQAVSAAIDRNQITEMLENTVSSTANLIPKGILGYRDFVDNSSFDPKKAQALLKQSGIKNLSDLDLKIYTISQMPLFTSIAENIIMQLKTHLNIEAKLIYLDRGTFMQKRSKKELGMTLHAWTAVFMDPSNFLYDLLYSKSKLNTFNYHNSTVDQLLLKGGEISENSSREKLYQQAEDIILKESPIIPICSLKRLMLINKRVKGIQYNPMELRPFRKISLN